MGRRKALLIGINYEGSKHALQGCRQDVRNMIPFLQSRGFSTDPGSMVILADDREGMFYPTGANMIAAMKWLVSEPNCSCWLSYSGHGSQINPDGDRASGFDDTIVPVDFERNGQIDSDLLHRTLVSALAPGCQLHIIFDCCHSGSAVELPYVYRSDADGNIKLMDNVKQGMHLLEAGSHLIQGGFSMQKLQDASQLWAGAQSFFHSMKHLRDQNQEGLGEEHFMEDWKEEHKRVFMYSGCRDDQTSADANISGGHVGAMSWAFLQVMKQYPQISYLDILRATRGLLKDRYSQIPQLSTGDNRLDLNAPFSI